MPSDMNLLKGLLVLAALVASPFLLIATMEGFLVVGARFVDSWRRSH